MPEDLKGFYIVQNGGHTEINLYEKDGNGYKVNEFLSFEHGRETIERIYLETLMI